MAKRLSPLAVRALEDALCKAFWFKASRFNRDSLKDFLVLALPDSQVVRTLNWSDSKNEIVRSLTTRLGTNGDAGTADLEHLVTELSKLDDFSHLLKLEDGQSKAEKAFVAISQLRPFAGNLVAVRSSDAQREQRRDSAANKQAKAQERLQSLDQLKAKFYEIHKLEPVPRGFKLEQLMYEVFNHFELDPHASFRNRGEQIDGCFSLQGTDYLFEAKWTDPVAGADLDIFSRQIESKLDNTLGLYLSMNGFTKDGVFRYERGSKKLICMTGRDLSSIFEARVGLPEMLVKKRQHASRTGEVLREWHEL